MRTACILGATGLVGSELLQLLINDNRYSNIILFVRRPLKNLPEKVKQHIIDFDNIEEWKHHLKGDVLFSAFGTTIRKAGSKEAQFKIDFTYQYEVAKAAQENGVQNYVLVSSTGANASSSNFYTRMKGLLDDEVQQLGFQKTILLRPSILAGNRNEFRLGEKIGIIIAQLICILPVIKKYRPINASIVATAMINGDLNTPASSIFELEEVHQLGRAL